MVKKEHAKRLTRLFIPVLFLAMGYLTGNAFADNTLAQTIDLVRPSIVGIGTVMPSRRPPSSFQGTGFVVSDGLHIITNAHVVNQVLDIENKEFLAIFTGRGETAIARPATKVAVDNEHDVALLKISGDPLPALTIGDSNTIQEGEEVAFTGFPIGTILGLYPVTHRAIISSITPIVIPAASSKKLDISAIKRLRTPFSVFQLDGTAYPGNSGSPVFNPKTGEVMGIINMVFVKGTKENALTHPSGIAYAIPGSFIRDIMKQGGAIRQSAADPISKLKR